MRSFFDSAQRLHVPRVDAILAVIGSAGSPDEVGEAPILAVHTSAFVDFLKPAPELWRAAGRPGDATP